MPFLPHSLPYKLRSLFDAKVCTPQDIARAAAISPVTIDRILRGAKPDPQTRVRIDQVLAYYSRLRNRHLKLETDSVEVVESQEYSRGVKWDLDCYDGTQGLTMRNTQGKRIFHCAMPAGIDADPLIEFLEWWIEVLEPTRITVATPSSGDAL